VCGLSRVYHATLIHTHGHQTCLERAAGLHAGMVERLFDSQEAAARLSHAISTITLDKDSRIATLELQVHETQNRYYHAEYIPPPSCSISNESDFHPRQTFTPVRLYVLLEHPLFHSHVHKPINTHIHIYTHMHTHTSNTHTYIHTHTHAHTRTYATRI